MSAKTTPKDAVQEAFENAPIGEPETDEERRMVAEAWASFERTGVTHSQEEAEAVVTALRKKQEGG